MSRQIIKVNLDVSVTDAIDTMLAHHIGGLFVVDVAGKLVGIVLEGDFSSDRILTIKGEKQEEGREDQGPLRLPASRRCIPPLAADPRRRRRGEDRSHF